MEGQKLTTKDFNLKNNSVYVNKNINNGAPGMILVFAEWCGHCRNFKPTFNELCKKLGNNFPCVSIEDTQFENDKAMSKALEVSGYPTIKFFDQNGKIINTYDGNRDKESILNHICNIYHHCMEKH